MGSTLQTFEYFRENPNHWSVFLNGLERDRNVELPILWSVHEAIKGMRDFSRTSRLRIERALALCDDAGISVTASTGFDPFIETTPLWARANWDVSALIPTSRIYRRPLGIELTSLASIHDFEFKSSWFSFLDELFSILGLYVRPEGPVEKIRIHLGLFSLDQGVLRVPGFAEALAKRYRTIEQLNLRYRSSFRGFDSVCSSQGFRVLLDKRPWHAIYDYRWCRQELLNSLTKEILHLPSAEPLADRIQIISTDAVSVSPTSSPLSVCVDSCFVESWSVSGDSYSFPVTPEGFLHPQASLALRIWKTIQTRAHQDGVAAHLLPMFDDLSSLPVTPYRIFVCGKYLAQSLAHEIQQFVGMGGHAIFPFGMPQFDETLQPLVWKQSSQSNYSLARCHAVVRRFGKGSMWVPSQLPAMDDHFWDEILDFASQIQMEGMH